MLSRKRNMNARIRVAHLKPTRGKRRWSIRGKTMPPIEPPVVASPVAAARRLMNQWAMAPTAGVKMREEPRPEMMEKVRMNCHSSGVSSISKRKSTKHSWKSRTYLYSPLLPSSQQRGKGSQQLPTTADPSRRTPARSGHRRRR